MPVKPITGVSSISAYFATRGVLQPFVSSSNTPLPSNVPFVYEAMLIRSLKMLRRGLVLDLSIAFGQFEIETSSNINILHQSEPRHGRSAEYTLISSQQVLVLLSATSTGTVCNCQSALHTRSLGYVACSGTHIKQATTFPLPGDAISSMQSWRTKGRRLPAWSKNTMGAPEQRAVTNERSG